MRTKPELPSRTTLPPAPPTNLRAVEERVGFLGRMKVNHNVSKEAARALIDVHTERVQADARVAKAHIAIVETIVTSALAADGMASIGALTVDLAAKTAVVQANLTSGAGAERIMHVTNRTATLQAINTRLANGTLLAEEAAALTSMANADTYSDIERTNRRTERSKDAVEVLHDFALGGLEQNPINQNYIRRH